MRAYILSIGSELMLGHLTDTNATFLAQELAAHGIELIHVTQVGDDRTRIGATLRTALDLADVVICTGGVGPTDDDLTREAISDVFDEEPSIDAGLYEQVAAFFAHRGQQMPARNAKQAWLIPSAEVLPNPIGTAPGWFARDPGGTAKVVVAMPGVPREMHRMWREQALPRILPLAGVTIIDTITLKTMGIGESAAEQAIHDLVAAAHPIVATYAKDDGVHVRVTAIGSDAAVVRAERQRATSVVQERLCDYIWGENDDTLATVLLRKLSSAGAKLALTEAGTGGSFTSLLSASSDSQSVFLGSSVLPTARTCDATVADFAAAAVGTSEATLGMGILLSVESTSAGRVEGRVEVALAPDGDSAEVFPAMNVRSSLPDAHRRAALHAADVLRRWLDSQARSTAA